LFAARWLATNLGPDAEGESCTLDCPAIRLPVIREKFLAEGATVAGICVSPLDWFGGRRW
jgi:hypothetical protein